MPAVEEQTLTDLDLFEHVLALRVLEDFVTTQLLRVGRPLKNSELSAAAEGFTLPRAALREGLSFATRVVSCGSTWELATRAEWSARPRDERARRPLESVMEELLVRIGKPLPAAVVAREIALMRGVRPETIKDSVINVLKTSRAAIEIAPSTYLHRSFILDAGAPTEEHIIAENQLEEDNDFVDFVWEEFPKESDDLEARVRTILEFVGRPLQQKTLGFLLWRQEPENFDARALLQLLADRTRFQPFVGGAIALQSQVPKFRLALANYAKEIGEATGEVVDVAALLRQRIAPADVIAPRDSELDQIRDVAANGQPLNVAQALTDIIEMEPEDKRFLGTLHGINDAMRNSNEYLPAGIGRWVLRTSIPGEAGQIPDALRPVTLALRDLETDEPLDVELSDDGLEGDCVEFIHAPQWEDLSEEVEVRVPRDWKSGETQQHIVLYPHWKSKTLKLRRIDETFFHTEGALTRIAVKTHENSEDGPVVRDAAAWASRDAGLIYGLGEWVQANLPQSGGVVEWTRRGLEFDVRAGTPDKRTLISDARIAELEALQERSAYLSLFELMQTIMGVHENGAELPTIWAEVNVVRRTSKRLLCSIVSGYNCFHYRQRGHDQLLWRFDEARLDQGFKRNKRKFVRK
jgi:hypothetical protein